MVKHKYAYNYKGRRGHFDNVSILFVHKYYDRPIEGVCEVNGHKLYFKKQEDEKCVSYFDPGKPGEFSCEELSDEELVRDCDLLCFYSVYYLEDHVLESLFQRQKEWERDCKLFNTIPDWEDKSALKELRQKVSDCNEDTKVYDEWLVTHLKESNIVGWFMCTDIKRTSGF